jgi:DnaK suppressor protein
MTLRKEKVETYRKQLIEKRNNLAQELKSATAAMLREDTFYTDTIDQAAAETDRNFSLQLKNRDRDVLWQIDEAIKRLDDGSFGACERCGEAISEGRIDAFPFATLCIDCKAELELKEHRFPQRA